MASSSATPPPYAVAFTWSTRAPAERLGELADALERAGLDDARRSRRGACRAAARVRATRVSSGSRRRPGLERSIYCTCPVRVVACPDKFRGTLPADEAAAAMAAGLRRAGFDDVVELPLADGGEGTLDTLLAARGGSRRTHAVTGPLGDPVDARVGRAAGRRRGRRDGAGERARARVAVATIRCARATRGTGELIAVARARGLRRRSSSPSAGARRPTAASPRSRRSDGRLQGIDVTVACDVDDAVPRRRARLRAAEGRVAARRSRCSTRRLAAARRAVPRRAPAST